MSGERIHKYRRYAAMLEMAKNNLKSDRDYICKMLCYDGKDGDNIASWLGNQLGVYAYYTGWLVACGHTTKGCIEGRRQWIDAMIKQLNAWADEEDA